MIKMLRLDRTLLRVLLLHVVHQSAPIRKLPLASNALKNWRHVTGLPLVLVTALVGSSALIIKLLERRSASIFLIKNSLVALGLRSRAIRLSILLCWSLPV